MLGDRALRLYRQGESCSVCIFKACEEHYKKKLPKELYAMCGGLTNGFGIGGMCSAAVTCVMFISYYFRDEALIKRARIYFLTAVKERLKYTDCIKLKKSCCNAIRECGELLEETINNVSKDI